MSVVPSNPFLPFSLPSSLVASPSFLPLGRQLISVASAYPQYPVSMLYHQPVTIVHPPFVYFHSFAFSFPIPRPLPLHPKHLERNLAAAVLRRFNSSYPFQGEPNPLKSMANFLANHIYATNKEVRALLKRKYKEFQIVTGLTDFLYRFVASCCLDDLGAISLVGITFARRIIEEPCVKYEFTKAQYQWIVKTLDKLEKSDVREFFFRQKRVDPSLEDYIRLECKYPYGTPISQFGINFAFLKALLLPIIQKKGNPSCFAIVILEAQRKLSPLCFLNNLYSLMYHGYYDVSGSRLSVDTFSREHLSCQTLLDQYATYSLREREIEKLSHSPVNSGLTSKRAKEYFYADIESPLITISLVNYELIGRNVMSPTENVPISSLSKLYITKEVLSALGEYPEAVRNKVEKYIRDHLFVIRSYRDIFPQSTIVILSFLVDGRVNKIHKITDMEMFFRYLERHLSIELPSEELEDLKQIFTRKFAIKLLKEVVDVKFDMKRQDFNSIFLTLKETGGVTTEVSRGRMKIDDSTTGEINRFFKEDREKTILGLALFSHVSCLHTPEELQASANWSEFSEWFMTHKSYHSRIGAEELDKTTVTKTFKREVFFVVLPDIMKEFNLDDSGALFMNVEKYMKAVLRDERPDHYLSFAAARFREGISTHFNQSLFYVDVITSFKRHLNMPRSIEIGTLSWADDSDSVFPDKRVVSPLFLYFEKGGKKLASLTLIKREGELKVESSVYNFIGLSLETASSAAP